MDTLTSGSVIGQYSILNESPFQFNARARTAVSMLILKRQDLLDLAESSDELIESVEAATDFILESEVPVCDYKSSRPPVTLAERFRLAVKKAIVLNRAKDLKRVKFLELIEFVKAQKKKQAQMGF